MLLGQAAYGTGILDSGAIGGQLDRQAVVEGKNAYRNDEKTPIASNKDRYLPKNAGRFKFMEEPLGLVESVTLGVAFDAAMTVVLGICCDAAVSPAPTLSELLNRIRHFVPGSTDCCRNCGDESRSVDFITTRTPAGKGA